MVGPPSQLTLRAQDGGHRDLGVTLGRRRVPSGSDLLPGTPPAASLQVPAGTMSRRQALCPGITQEEVLFQHQDAGWGVPEPPPSGTLYKYIGEGQGQEWGGGRWEGRPLLRP